MVMNDRSLYQPRIQTPPSTWTGEDGTWGRKVYDILNGLPPISTASIGNPNSNISAIRGSVLINFSSATSVLWAKTVGSGNTGWVALA